MNKDVQKQMQKDLIEGRFPLGMVVAIATMLVVGKAASAIPGMRELTKAHDWPTYVLLVVATIVGAIASFAYKASYERRVEGYDDDQLKFNYDKLQRKKLFSNILWWIGIAAVALFFALK